MVPAEIKPSICIHNNLLLGKIVLELKNEILLQFVKLAKWKALVDFKIYTNFYTIYVFGNYKLFPKTVT